MFAVWSRYADITVQPGFLPSLAASGVYPAAVHAALALGLWMLYNGHLQMLDRQSERSARQAVTLMETMLAHAESANRTLLPFVEQPCEQALFTLRQQVALVPFVRTVNLVGSRIYCNSLFGAIQWPDRAESYSDGRLRLLAGNQVRADHPLLALRDSEGRGPPSAP